MGYFVLAIILLAIVVAILEALLPVLKWVGIAILVVICVGLIVNLLRAAGRWAYHFLNPSAKRRYQAKLEKEAEHLASQKAFEQAQREIFRAAEAAKSAAKRQRDEAESLALREKHAAEERRRIAAQEEAEVRRQSHRDADTQDVPYVYEIGTHGNESLAIRYGIANHEKKIKEYWYFARGGERVHNPDKDTFYFAAASTIRLQKIGRVGPHMYDVLLTDFNNRQARAVIEAGTEYVKTFYPLDERWFEKHSDLELTLKGNGTFTLKELATFHVQKAV